MKGEREMKSEKQTNERWKKPLMLFAGLVICISSSCAWFDSGPSKVYVSTTGNDAWSGRLAQANKELSDGPVQSLEKARDIVRRLKSDGELQQRGIDVCLREGAYSMTKTFQLDEQDSGTEKSSVVWRNYRNEKVQLVGGREITAFEPISDSAILKRLSDEGSANILQVDLKSEGIADYGHFTARGNPALELFFQDKRMPLARWPNEGWVKIAEVPQSGTMIDAGELPHMRHGVPVGRHFGRFAFSEDPPLKWSNMQDVVLHGYWTWDWYDEFLQVKSIDKKRKEIFIQEPHSSYGYCKEQRFYAANILEELDRPGEWYLDRRNGMLYFWPPAPLNEARAFVSILSEPIFVLDNTQHVSIRGMIFEFSRGSAIEIKGGNNNLIAGCTVRNVGGLAVNIQGGENNGITSCDIYSVSSGGISLSGGDRKTLTPAFNFADNNHIYDYSSWIRTYQPAISISGVGNRLAHNDIHDAPHSGIILSGNEHVLEYNELYRLAKETGDVGAFYMGRDWTQRGNIIRYNYFHDLVAPGLHGVNAVYLDDWSSGTEIYGNVFHKAGLGVMIGGGRDNIVSDNVFIDCNPSVHVDSRGLGWAKYYFDGSVNTLFDRMDAMKYSQPPYSEKYPELLTLYDDEPAVAKNNHIFNNVSTGEKWLNLHNGLDLTVVDVQTNIVYQQDDAYKNEHDFTQASDSNFVSIEDDEIKVKKSVTRKYDLKLKPLKKMGNYEDEYRK
jgi:hypothetical protein